MNKFTHHVQFVQQGIYHSLEGCHVDLRPPRKTESKDDPYV